MGRNSRAKVKARNVAPFGRYFPAMLERGVLVAASQFKAGIVSTAHTKEDIDRTVAWAE